MKKSLLILLSAAVLLSFAGCDVVFPNNGAGGSSSQTVGESSNNTQSTSSRITRDEAKAIAFGNAGVNEADVYDLEIALDEDDGVVSYEIEFKSSGTEYKYDIHAESGKIIEKDIDRD